MPHEPARRTDPLHAGRPDSRRRTVTRPTLRSDRIELRPMTPEHLPHLVALDADAEVLRFILGRARTAGEAEAFWGPKCAETGPDAVGLGWWVGFGPDDEFLGWWDLSPDVPVPRRPVRAEAGWRLRREHWGRGLATEGARELLAHGFDTVGLDVVWAETMAVNTASRAVMAKLGMRHVRTHHPRWAAELPGAAEGEVVYEIARDSALVRA